MNKSNYISIKQRLSPYAQWKCTDTEWNAVLHFQIETIPQGTVDMNTCTEVVSAEDVTGHQYSIAINTPITVVYVKGGSREEINRWAFLDQNLILITATVWWFHLFYYSCLVLYLYISNIYSIMHIHLSREFYLIK